MSYRDYTPGIRYAITWLHARAEEMNDPKARQVLNAAAFGLGVDHAHHHKPKDGIVPIPAAPPPSSVSGDPQS